MFDSHRKNPKKLEPCDPTHLLSGVLSQGNLDPVVEWKRFGKYSNFNCDSAKGALGLSFISEILGGKNASAWRINLRRGSFELK